MSKHTPVPWKANFAISGAAYIFGGDRNFACVFNEWKDEENQEANARLIAAAPELLEALAALLDLNDNYSYFGGEIYRDRIDRAWDNARAAIAKARGEK